MGVTIKVRNPAPADQEDGHTPDDQAADHETRHREVNRLPAGKVQVRGIVINCSRGLTVHGGFP